MILLFRIFEPVFLFIISYHTRKYNNNKYIIKMTKQKQKTMKV